MSGGEDNRLELYVIVLTGAEPGQGVTTLQSLFEQEFHGSIEVLLVRVGWAGRET